MRVYIYNIQYELQNMTLTMTLLKLFL